MKTSGNSVERNALFRHFKSELNAHSLAEEQTFYSEPMELPEGTEKVRHSVSEHKDIDDPLQELCELQLSSGGWIHKFEKLHRKVIHHLDEEENDVFHLARHLISVTRAQELRN